VIKINKKYITKKNNSINEKDLNLFLNNSLNEITQVIKSGVLVYSVKIHVIPFETKKYTILYDRMIWPLKGLDTEKLKNIVYNKLNNRNIIISKLKFFSISYNKKLS